MCVFVFVCFCVCVFACVCVYFTSGSLCGIENTLMSAVESSIDLRVTPAEKGREGSEESSSYRTCRFSICQLGAGETE